MKVYEKIYEHHYVFSVDSKDFLLSTCGKTFSSNILIVQTNVK